MIPAMTNVLVTGGTGVLGGHVVPRLVAAGHQVRVLSRKADPSLPAGVAGVQGDLGTGEGLDQATAGVEAVVHLASSPFRHTKRTDVEGTQRLADAALAHGSPHLLYVSIVGVDRHPFRYYRAKLATEQVVAGCGLPWTTLRATQFHDLIHVALHAAARLPVVLVPRGWVFQPVDSAEVAGRLAPLVDGPAEGMLPDMGGPEVRAVEDLARAYLDAVGRRPRVAQVPTAGRSARAMRAGLHTCPDHADGTVTWEQFLATH
jgi:uncharacterized protein YbjT (DUF2867 family)